MARLTTQCVCSFIHSSDPFIHSLVDRVRGLENRFVFKHTHKIWGYKVVHSGYPTHICETEQDFGSPEEAEAASDLERNESRQCGILPKALTPQAALLRVGENHTARSSQFINTLNVPFSFFATPETSGGSRAILGHSVGS